MDSQTLAGILMPLMERYQRGDAEAASELVDRLNPILMRFFQSFSAQQHVVDDMVQECWLRIHRARHSYQPGRPLLPWIFAVARHTQVDQYRRRQRTSGRESHLEGMATEPSEDPGSQWQASLAAAEIMRIVDGLPAGQREVLMMLKLGDLSVEEVASATGSTASAVKQKAFRAYQAVRSALGLGGKEGKGVELR